MGVEPAGGTSFDRYPAVRSYGDYTPADGSIQSYRRDHVVLVRVDFSLIVVDFTHGVQFLFHVHTLYFVFFAERKKQGQGRG